MGAETRKPGSWRWSQWPCWRQATAFSDNLEELSAQISADARQAASCSGLRPGAVNFQPVGKRGLRPQADERADCSEQQNS